MSNSPITFQSTAPAFQKPYFSDLPEPSQAQKDSADAVDFWVAQYSDDIALDKAVNQFPDTANNDTILLNDLNLVRPSVPLAVSESFNLADAVHDVLRYSVEEIHELHEADRGRHLAHLLGLLATGEGFDLFRFNIGHVLARYVAAMPLSGMCLGVLPNEDVDQTMVLWDTKHGLFLDVVHVERFDDDYIDADIDAALTFGVDVWGLGFAGVRYLPLHEMGEARWCGANRSWVSVVERDFLNLTSQFKNF